LCFLGRGGRPAWRIGRSAGKRRPPVLTSYASLDEAQRGLADFLEESPERESALGLATVDDDGNAVSVPPAAELHVTR